MPAAERQAMHDRWKVSYQSKLVQQLEEAVADHLAVQKQAGVSNSQ